MRARRRAPAEPAIASSEDDADALVGVVFGCGEPSIKPTEALFEQACEMAWRGWQVLGVTAPRILKWGGTKHANSSAGRRLTLRAAGAKLYADVQDSLCRRIAAELSDRSIPHVLLKGSALRYASYEQPALRCGFDLDLGIPKSRLREAEDVVRDAGYFPAQWDPEASRFVIADPRLRANVERSHYELGFLVRHQILKGVAEPLLASFDDESPDFRIWHRTEAGDAGCYCAVDLHHAISHDIPVEPFLSGVAEPLSGLRTPSLDLQLFHLIFKLYWEGVHSYGKGLYQITDLVHLMRHIDSAVFNRCRQWLAQFHLEAAGYYVLRRLGALSGQPIPAFVQAFITETAVPKKGLNPISENDLGDLWSKLQGRR